MLHMTNLTSVNTFYATEFKLTFHKKPISVVYLLQVTIKKIEKPNPFGRLFYFYVHVL